LWRLYTEIQKLVHFAAGNEITATDIEKNVCAAPEINIFKTVDAIAARDKKTAFDLTARHIEKGDHPLYLLAMIGAQFKNLLLTKLFARRGAGALGIHPYVFSKTLRQANYFDSDRLKKNYRRICQTDFYIKTGALEPAPALDLLIAEL
jgi:DNA polymerase-3 subunit delta